jgi:murein DD-endopeptidase MepM/ murein hydrolase activator NlpD
MKLKYSTLMFLSESSNKTRSFRVPSMFLWILACFILILAAGFISGFVLYNKLSLARHEASKLLEENLILLQENQKLQQLEENLKSNTLLLKKVLGLIGVASNQSGMLTGEAQDSAVAAFMENSDELLNLSKPLTGKDIVNLIPSGMPSEGRVTRGFNPEDENISRRHFGIDIVNKEGSKIYATADGVVEFAGWDDMYGKFIIIDHSSSAGSEGYKTYFGHNLVNLVSEGEIVQKGDLIALSGNTGRSTGPHTHYEIRKNGNPVNPMDYVKSNNYTIGN